VDRDTSKVQVIRRGNQSRGVPFGVEPVIGNILCRDVPTQFRAADIQIGCVDKAFRRQVFCEFAYRNHRLRIEITVGPLLVATSEE
jgi:hypothetical protein